MEKVIRRILISTTLIVLLFTFFGCIKKDGATDDLATIQGGFQLDGLPSGPWNGIEVTITGRENFTIQTTATGNFTVNVLPAVYTVEAGKTGYTPVSIQVNASLEGQTYDIGTANVLFTTSPPSDPF